MDIGNAIKRARQKAKLSQIELAKACGWDSQSRISMYEKGRREPTLGDLEHIGKVCNTTVLQIIEDAMESKSGPRPKPRKLNQDDLDLLDGYARLSDDKRTAIWDIIDGHLRQLDPTLDRLLGPRNVQRSKSAEPGLIAAQAIERAKGAPAAKGPSRKKKD